MPAAAQKLSDDLPPESGPVPATRTFMGFSRAECAGGPRPCPLVGCPHNNYLNVDRETGKIRLTWPGVEPEDVAPDKSCCLDSADTGGKTLEEVGEILNLTRERIRQIEIVALEKIRSALGDDWLDQQEDLR